MRKKISGKRLFILDTNVLIHDPTAIFRFKEHDIFLPMVVLEELDNGKKGLSEPARAIRQTNRFLEALMNSTPVETILEGVPLTPKSMGLEDPSITQLGRLYFQTKEFPSKLPDSLPGNKSDNAILAVALALQKNFRSSTTVTLVTKDVNLRIKAAILGIVAEDYFSDQVLDDMSLMYTGLAELPPDFFAQNPNLETWKLDEQSFCRVQGSFTKNWHPNVCIASPEKSDFSAIVHERTGESAVLAYSIDYRRSKNTVSGITARNKEQNFALNLLLNPQIDFVTLLGPAGTGKTLLTLAAAIQQTVRDNRYREILITRITVPLGEDIGFLPGTEEEKMTPWMGAFIDNLEVLYPSFPIFSSEDSARMLMKNRIRIRSLNFMRGRTFLNKFVIIDEAQNLTPKQMRTLITRAGPGTKIVCLGNTAQIDTPYLTETTCGLTYVVNQFKNWNRSGHLILTRGERSALADYATAVL